MAHETDDNPRDNPGFEDLVEELEEDSSFEWDDEQMEPDDPEQTRPVVCVRVGDDLFALPGESVREIRGGTETTPMPGAPAHIEGVTVVHRRVLGLMSLADFLGIEPDAQPEDTDDDPLTDHVSTDRVLVVETPHYAVGVRVDEVVGLDDWPESRLDPDTLPENIRDSTHRYARGARRQEGTLCVYLDVDALLDDAAVP